MNLQFEVDAIPVNRKTFKHINTNNTILKIIIRFQKATKNG